MRLSLDKVMIRTSGGDHGGVVGAVGTLREEDVDSAFLPVAREALSQVGVRGHSTDHDQSLKAIASRCFKRFLGQHVDNARQEGGGDVLLLLPRIFL